jgi:hypothetical protein
VRPHEVVVAAKQLQVIFETLLPTQVADRPPKRIGRALSDREIQPLDERSVQFRGVLRVAQRLFESPRVADQRSSLDLDDAIVPTGLDDLAVQTRWPPKCDGQLSCRTRIRLRRPEGHVQDSFGWRRLKESDRVSVASVSLPWSQAKAEIRRQSW